QQRTAGGTCGGGGGECRQRRPKNARSPRDCLYRIDHYGPSRCLYSIDRNRHVTWPPRKCYASTRECVIESPIKGFLLTRMNRPFDPNEFLARVGGGRTISKYRKHQ